MFVIERKFKTWGNKYVVKPCEGEWEWDSVQKLKDKAIIFRADSCTGTAVSDTYPYPPPLDFLVFMYITIFEQKISVIWQIFKVNTMVIR